MKSKLRRKRALKLDITNVLADGAYTAALYIGRKKTCINVYLDTGSSTFVVDNDAYNPTTDRNMKATKMAQELRYIDGSGWQGAVVNTHIEAMHGRESRQINGVHIAVADRNKDFFVGECKPPLFSLTSD